MANPNLPSDVGMTDTQLLNASGTPVINGTEVQAHDDPERQIVANNDPLVPGNYDTQPTPAAEPHLSESALDSLSMDDDVSDAEDGDIRESAEAPHGVPVAEPVEDPAGASSMDPNTNNVQVGNNTQELDLEISIDQDDQSQVQHDEDASRSNEEFDDLANVGMDDIQLWQQRLNATIAEDGPPTSRQDNSDEEDTLFVPDEPRAPAPRAQPLRTSAPYNRPSATPGPSSQRPSSRMAPLPVATSGLASRKSVFNKIRNMQKNLHQDKAHVNRPTQRVQPTPDGETYLQSILSRKPRDEASTSTGIFTGDEHDKADKEAQANYRKQKKHYDSLRKENGKLSFAEDVEWMRIQRAETSRKEKRKRDLEMAREDNGDADLFPNDFGIGNGRNDDGPEEDFVDDDLAGSVRKQKVSSRGGFPSMREAELHSMEVALHADGDNPRKKRKGASMPEEAQEAPSGRDRGRPKSSKSKSSASSSATRAKTGGRKTAKDKKEIERAVRMGKSLIYSDVFQQQAGGNAPAEATFTARNKQDALKELIASVPIEHQKSAKDDKAALLRDSKDFDGHGSCRPTPSGMWKVKGMKSTLKNYQVMGTAFMRRRERAAEEPRGGLMADQMGLGKTVMMLANIVNGRKPNAECKTTLLVASPALLNQWAEEIKLHTEAGLVVMRYTAGVRLDSTHAFAILAHHDIILTTYHEVMKSYPKNEPPIECQSAQQKIDWWKHTYENERGPLHRMMFHRIVLDEAQAIKNHTSRTSIACRALMAHHKWALSGTPILNSLDELYSYFKFLSVPYTGSFKIFKHNYTDPNEPASVERLLARLSQFMIRRDHSNVLFNAPILKLPQASKMTHWCGFNHVERSIYEVVRQRFAKRINLQAKQGTLDKSYSNALVMLLRLRQLTAHILLLQSVAQELLEQEDIEKIREIVQQEATDTRSKSGATIRIIRRQLEVLEVDAKKKSQEKTAKGAKGLGATPTFYDDEVEEQRDIEDLLRDRHDPGGDDGRRFGKTFDFRPYLNSLTRGTSWEKVKARATCCDCGKTPQGGWMTSCGHLLCSICYEDGSIMAAEEGRVNANCKTCGSIFTHANQVGNEGDLVQLAGPGTRSKAKTYAQEQQRIEQQDIGDDWLAMDKGGVLPSAKTIALKAQLLNWFKETPGVKIIIYTQFLAMIKIMARMCQEEGWGIEEYHGKMSQNARDKAIRHFASEPNVRVLLASLRCGGLGLNLTMASRVVILDPWWNSAAEQQAFCRVFRFGQDQETFLTRLCVRGTVDERLIEMQERKQKEIDSVMEDDGKKVAKMDTRDLMRLFGNIRDDESGRPFILIDNADPRGGFHADSDHEGFADEL